MELSKEIQWQSHIEEYLKDMAEKSYCYAYLHKRAEAKYSALNTKIDIPVIVLSTIAGTLSIGGEGIFGKDNVMASQIIGSISLMVGVLNTISSYFSWNQRTENHRISSIQYSKLFRFLEIELSLPRNERMSAGDLLKVSRESYERLQEVSNLIPDSIIKSFKKKFKSYDVAKPSEANGLEAIHIYKEKTIKSISEDERTKSDGSLGLSVDV